MAEIIGVSGPIHAGKTTVCEYLVRKHGFTYYEVSDFIGADLGMKLRIPYLVEEKDDWRYLLQGWGHLARIKYGEDYWIGKIMPLVVAPAVLGGLRYVEDIEGVRNRGGKVIRVESIYADNENTAPTETALKGYTKYDLVLRNDTRNYDDLYKQIDKYLEDL